MEAEWSPFPVIKKSGTKKGFYPQRPHRVPVGISVSITWGEVSQRLCTIGAFQGSGCSILLVDMWAARGTDWQSPGSWRDLPSSKRPALWKRKEGSSCISYIAFSFSFEKVGLSGCTGVASLIPPVTFCFSMKQKRISKWHLELWNVLSQFLCCLFLQVRSMT